MKKGFTLVELLVVLVIIGILVALILPNTLKAIDSANVKQAASTLRAIDTALNLCYSETQDWTQCTLADLQASNKYMDTLPNNGNSPWGDNPYAIAQDPNTLNYSSVKLTIFPNWPSLNPVNR